MNLIKLGEKRSLSIFYFFFQANRVSMRQLLSLSWTKLERENKVNRPFFFHGRKARIGMTGTRQRSRNRKVHRFTETRDRLIGDEASAWMRRSFDQGQLCHSFVILHYLYLYVSLSFRFFAFTSLCHSIFILIFYSPLFVILFTLFSSFFLSVIASIYSDYPSFVFPSLRNCSYSIVILVKIFFSFTKKMY